MHVGGNVNPRALSLGLDTQRCFNRDLLTPARGPWAWRNKLLRLQQCHTINRHSIRYKLLYRYRTIPVPSRPAPPTPTSTACTPRPRTSATASRSTCYLRRRTTFATIPRGTWLPATRGGLLAYSSLLPCALCAAPTQLVDSATILHVCVYSRIEKVLT